MNFSNITLVTTGGTTVFNPYDRGAKGAFVYRESGTQVHAQRIVANIVTNDTASDRYSFQVNAPRVTAPVSGPVEVLGTDLVSVDVRFLATTSGVDRIEQVNKAIKLLEHMRSTISLREKIYS